MLSWLVDLLFPSPLVAPPPPSAAHKGEDGEYALIRKLARAGYTEDNGYDRYDNIVLPDGRGGTTEIDSIMFSRYGVVVFEVKNYSGWIFGKSADRQWTQMLNRHSKYRFQNPLRQNYKHIAALRSITRLPRGCFHSIVVFTGDADFKTAMPVNVGYLGDVPDMLSSTTDTIKLTDSQVQNAITLMRKHNQSNHPQTAEQHRNYVQGRHR